jgi:hypothetical protein
VRLAFRSKEGRYIPPYGHRTQINNGWFQDYGGDLKQRDSSFGYIDGTFQVELPVCEIFVEMMKGFEYEAVRRRITIKPGQRELTLVKFMRSADENRLSSRKQRRKRHVRHFDYRTTRRGARKASRTDQLTEKAAFRALAGGR